MFDNRIKLIDSLSQKVGIFARISNSICINMGDFKSFSEGVSAQVEGSLVTHLIEVAVMMSVVH